MISADTLRIFVAELRAFQRDDITAGIRSLMLRPRESGQTAFPDLGTVVDAVKTAVRDRCSIVVAGRRRRADEEEIRQFDAFLAERVADGAAEEEILSRWPSMAKKWAEWKADT